MTKRSCRVESGYRQYTECRELNDPENSSHCHSLAEQDVQPSQVPQIQAFVASLIERTVPRVALPSCPNCTFPALRPVPPRRVVHDAADRRQVASEQKPSPLRPAWD